MPANPAFKVTYPEWRTVLDALNYYRQHLQNRVETIEDEDAQLIVYDDLERLDLIIPSLERQFKQYTEHTAPTDEEWKAALNT